MNGIYFCKLFLESTFTFANWNLNLQLTSHYIFQLYSRIKLRKSLEKTIVYDRIEIKMLYYAFLRIVVQNAFDT